MVSRVGAINDIAEFLASRCARVTQSRSGCRLGEREQGTLEPILNTPIRRAGADRRTSHPAEQGNGP